MLNLFSNSDDYFDEDYFENGKKTGKSWYENYHWIPERSFGEANAFISYLNLNKESDYILDYGTAKGFLVKAFRTLGFRADGCDISKYALGFAPEGCWNCSIEKEWENRSYSWVLAKDVFEHMNYGQVIKSLKKISTITEKLVCVVPIGDNGVYRIPEYHFDPSHIIAEDEGWWISTFKVSGWNVTKMSAHVSGIKDNWLEYHKFGNSVFVLERKTI